MEPNATPAASIHFDAPIRQPWLFGLNPRKRSYRSRIASVAVMLVLAGILGCSLSFSQVISPFAALTLCAASGAGLIVIQWLWFRSQFCLLCGACTKGPFAGQRATWCPGCDNLNDPPRIGLTVANVLDLSQPNYRCPSDPIARFLALCVYLALVDKGHEITFEPDEDEYHIYIENDGGVFELVPPPMHIEFRAAQTLKALAGIDPLSCYEPREGHLYIKLSNRFLSVDALIEPTRHGQKIRLRWEAAAATETLTAPHVGT